MTQINKDTFFYYFLQETGGLYDPRQLNLMIEKLKEWISLHSCVFNDRYAEGYKDALNHLKENLK
jgi:hypothetical protein